MASVQYRLVALDLDGTLLNHQHAISEQNKKIIVHLHRAGIQIAICTGRSTPCCLPYLEGFPNDFDVSLVTFNGACCLSKKGETGRNLLFHQPVTAAVTNMAIDFAIANNFVLNVYFDQKIFAHCKNACHLELTRRYEELTSCTYDRIPNEYEQFRDTPISKILVLVEEARLEIAYQLLRESLTAGEAHLVRGDFFIEILHPTVNKGNGLRGLCQALEIPLEQVVALGDGDNDSEFLQYAGLGIAMLNGSELAKRSANMVSEKCNDDDGVAIELSKIFSI